MISLPHKIRKLFLSPDSKFELWLRTQYHKVMATRIAFKLQDFIAKHSYHRWRTKLNNQECFDNDQLIHNIKISFVISLGDSNSDGFIETITSLSPIPDQYKDVHVVVKGDSHRSDLSVQYLDDYNIHQLNSDMTDLLDLLSGHFVIFCQAGDQFHKNFFQQFSQYSSIYTETEVFYYDCEYYEPNTKRLTPFFKPQKISPALMLSTNMLSRSLISLSVLKEIWKSVDFNLSFQALEYEFCLILCENGINYRHIPRLLLTQVSPVISDDADNAKAISQYLVTKGLKGVTVDHSHTLPRFTWQSNNPSVAIIIPTRNNADYLEPLLKSITATTENINYSINLVDNGSDDQNTLDYYSNIENDEKIKIISYDKPFNYSEAINIGVNQTDSDLILLMNDDMLVKNNEWLSELIQWAILPEVGIVGAKLLRLNHSIQHAGIILGLTGFMGHLYLNAPEHYHGLFGSVDWYRNFLAVTGALQMMRRVIFKKVGGYDQGYKLAFGDIDFCLRVYQAGYQIVYTPYTQIYHHEGSSRGYTTPAQDVLKGYDVMNEYIINGDPYFSPNLTTTRIPRCQTHRVTNSDRLKQIKDRRKFYLRE